MIKWKVRDAHCIFCWADCKRGAFRDDKNDNKSCVGHLPVQDLPEGVPKWITWGER